MSFTHDVRDELAHTEPGPKACRLAEMSAMLRFGGAVQIRGGAGVGYVIDTDVGAVARRLRAALDKVLSVTPTLEVHQPTGLRRTTTWRLGLHDAARPALVSLGILSAQGLPVAGVPASLVHRDEAAVAYLRGAVMLAGSVSDPRRAPHLEIRAPGAVTARELAALVERCGVDTARAAEHGGWRVTVKSGEAIGGLLARLGAHTSFLRWDGDRLRRELRGAANRAANADRANVSRAVAASSRQTAAIQRAMTGPWWDNLPEELRAVALARLASPEASLTDLGALLDPPVGKSTVHRRLATLMALVEEFDVSRGPVE